MQTGLCIAVWLLGNLVAVGAYDLFAYFTLPDDQSVSYWLQKWMRAWPALAVLVGYILGHLTWPLHISKEP